MLKTGQLREASIINPKNRHSKWFHIVTYLNVSHFQIQLPDRMHSGLLEMNGVVLKATCTQQ